MWIEQNQDLVCDILSEYPRQITLLLKNFRKEHIDIIRIFVTKVPRTFEYLPHSEQVRFIDLAKKAVKNNALNVSLLPHDIQNQMGDAACRKVINRDEDFCYAPWENLSADMQEKFWKLISKRVCEGEPSWLEYVAPEVLLAHPEICKAAIKKHGCDVIGIIPEVVLEKYPSLYKIMVKNCPGSVRKIPEKYQTTRMWDTALKQTSWLVGYLPKELMTAKRIKKAVAGENPVLYKIPEELRTAEICRISVAKFSFLLEDVPERIQMAFPDICESAIMQDADVIRYVPESVQLEYPYLCKLAVTTGPVEALRYIRPSVPIYTEICRLALAQYNTDYWTLKSVEARMAMGSGNWEMIYTLIDPDVLKENIDFINDIRKVITVAKTEERIIGDIVRHQHFYR